MKDTTYAERLREASKRELIATCMELARVAVDAESRTTVDIGRPSQAFDAVKDIGAGKQERLVGLYLDAQNKLICRRTISVGSLNTTRSHPREILYPAVQHLALGIILAHNHPSGCMDPSPEDIEFTQAVAKACKLLGVELYDHLIVGREGFTSMRERGVL